MKILVGYDGTNVARDAVLTAQQHAKIFDAEIDVITAIPQSHKLGYEEIQEAEDKLQREMRNLFEENTIPHKEHLVVSKQSAGEELVEFAKRNNAFEIIIGVRRRSKVGKLLFGSTAQYVILNAPCPVVTIK